MRDLPKAPCRSRDPEPFHIQISRRSRFCSVPPRGAALCPRHESVITSSPTHTASREIPSCLPARLRARGPTARCRRRRRRIGHQPRLRPIMPSGSTRPTGTILVARTRRRTSVGRKRFVEPPYLTGSRSAAFAARYASARKGPSVAPPAQYARPDTDATQLPAP